AIGDDAGAAARLQPAAINIAGRSGTWVASRIDDEDMARWAFFHRPLLQRPAAAGSSLVLARRNEAHRKSCSDQPRRVWPERPDILQKHVLEPAPAEDAGQGRGTDLQ